MKSERYRSINAASSPHGTRARYVHGCRCEACKRSNVEFYHRRMDLIHAAAATVQPSGPPLDGTLERGGRTYRVKRCPGANGASCVRGGTWLRTGAVCLACVERASVWNGLVDAAPVRAHLQQLSRRGIGYKSAADAASAARSVVGGVLRGEVTQLRADTARRILAVDEGARAGGALVSSARQRRLIDKLLDRGFTRAELAELLGYKSPALQLGARGKTTARTLAAVEKLWRRVERGELTPSPAFVDSDDSLVRIGRLRARGVSQSWLEQQLGFALNLEIDRPPTRLRREQAEAIARLYDEFEREFQRALRQRDIDEVASSRGSDE